jgi:POT family proton-dependent oligopeptide transporter
MRKKVSAIFKNYPRGFEALCITQTLYNFSFYGLKSIFVLYVIAQHAVTESEAISLFATLMALSYATSLIGGWVADNTLSTKSSIVLGGLFQALGIFLLMFPSEDLVFVALTLISLGSGFFKPNLSASVGMLFENPHDSQKDKAYSTFYMVMNIGSFIGPLLCGFVSKTYGGYYNTLLLIVVTLIGGIYFFYQQTNFKQQKEPMAYKHALFSHPIFPALSFLLLFGTLYLLFKHHESFSQLMSAIAIGSIFYLGKIAYQCTSQERKNISKIILYILGFTLFCALFEQAGTSLILFFDKAVNRDLLGIEIPSAALLALGPIFVIICAPLLILFSEKILEKNKSLNGMTKLGIGFVLTGLSFVILALSCNQSDIPVPLLWIVGSILVQTLGELFIVPIGYSNISKLAPSRFRSVMMSFWLMAIAYGHYIGGLIAKFSVNESASAQASLDHYQTFFWNLALMPCGLGIVLIMLHYVRTLWAGSVRTVSEG